MMIEHLEWDSAFFGRNIGKLEIKDNNKLIAQQKDNLKKYELVYIFSDQRLSQDYNLVDIKVVFQKKTTKKLVNEHIVHFNSSLHNYEQLLKLTYQSGHDSRFLKDSFFSEKDFKNLYKTWIDKSIANKETQVLVYVQQYKILGFVSFKNNIQTSTIELIAVDTNARGVGIGSKLIDAVENKLITNTILTVPTQETNRLACNFYSKKEFKIVNKKYIYHYTNDTIQ